MAQTSCRSRLAAGLVGLLACPAIASAAQQPDLALQVQGPPAVVFRHQTQACDRLDIPDAPARAVRGSDGQVQLYATHFLNRRLLGPNLLSLSPDCRVVFRGAERDDPAAFDDRSWIASLATRDGHTIEAIVHEEFQGDRRPWLCPSGRYIDCWYNALVLAVSDDGGASFHRRAGAQALVAALPTRFEAGVGHHAGYFNPTGMVVRDGQTFLMAFLVQAGGQREGNCLLRTTNVSDPKAWRGWDGHGFGISFVDPYAPAIPSGPHLCEPLAAGQLRWPVTSLVRHEPDGIFVAVMMDARRDGGIYYATSRDLVAWSEPVLLLHASGPASWRCGDPPPLAYPSLLDPHSPARDFSTVGGTAELFVTRFVASGCHLSMDRDLVRIPVRLQVR